MESAPNLARDDMQRVLKNPALPSFNHNLYHKAMALERRKMSRSECIAQKVQEVNDSSPPDTDAVICYHGDNTATGPRNLDGYSTLKAPLYDYRGYYECGGVGYVAT